jgi:hypothetical protein
MSQTGATEYAAILCQDRQALVAAEPLDCLCLRESNWAPSSLNMPTASVDMASKIGRWLLFDRLLRAERTIILRATRFLDIVGRARGFGWELDRNVGGNRD